MSDSPEWLARHDGSLTLGPDKATRLILFSGSPQYKVVPTPANGKFSCAVMQTVNGKRLDNGEIYPTEREAVNGGLEVLRKTLGW